MKTKNYTFYILLLTAAYGCGPFNSNSPYLNDGIYSTKNYKDTKDNYRNESLDKNQRRYDDLDVNNDAFLVSNKDTIHFNPNQTNIYINNNSLPPLDFRYVDYTYSWNNSGWNNWAWNNSGWNSWAWNDWRWNRWRNRSRFVWHDPCWDTWGWNTWNGWNYGCGRWNGWGWNGWRRPSWGFAWHPYYDYNWGYYHPWQFNNFETPRNRRRYYSAGRRGDLRTNNRNSTSSNNTPIRPTRRSGVSTTNNRNESSNFRRDSRSNKRISEPKPRHRNSNSSNNNYRNSSSKSVPRTGRSGRGSTRSVSRRGGE